MQEHVAESSMSHVIEHRTNEAKDGREEAELLHCPSPGFSSRPGFASRASPPSVSILPAKEALPQSSSLVDDGKPGVSGADGSAPEDGAEEKNGSPSLQKRKLFDGPLDGAVSEADTCMGRTSAPDLANELSIATAGVLRLQGGHSGESHSTDCARQWDSLCTSPPSVGFFGCCNFSGSGTGAVGFVTPRKEKDGSYEATSACPDAPMKKNAYLRVEPSESLRRLMRPLFP